MDSGFRRNEGNERRNEGNEGGVTGMRPELGERGRNYG